MSPADLARIALDAWGCMDSPPLSALEVRGFVASLAEVFHDAWHQGWWRAYVELDIASADDLTRQGDGGPDARAILDAIVEAALPAVLSGALGIAVRRAFGCAPGLEIQAVVAARTPAR